MYLHHYRVTAHEFTTNTRAFVFNFLTGLLTAKEIHFNKCIHIAGLKLADPDIYKPAAVDLLLESDVYADFILPEIARGEDATNDGRYQVGLPFKDGCQPALGPSKLGVLRRFHQLEKRLQNNTTQHRNY